MTEKEILDRLKIGDHLLEVYKELIQPVADALAELKSKAVYGKKGCYSGDLGNAFPAIGMKSAGRRSLDSNARGSGNCRRLVSSTCT
jgi:hypothetical protein